jgi:hypothetical protein
MEGNPSQTGRHAPCGCGSLSLTLQHRPPALPEPSSDARPGIAQGRSQPHLTAWIARVLSLASSLITCHRGARWRRRPMTSPDSHDRSNLDQRAGRRCPPRPRRQMRIGSMCRRQLTPKGEEPHAGQRRPHRSRRQRSAHGRPPSGLLQVVNDLSIRELRTNVAAGLRPRCSESEHLALTGSVPAISAGAAVTTNSPKAMPRTDCTESSSPPSSLLGRPPRLRAVVVPAQTPAGGQRRPEIAVGRRKVAQ